ncbi:uncharacterized protein LOC142342899 isoform X2 [Convolutriloba macropyga]|uniref:uncharacterized protein LOC142342899 isoform X2 n=1 Tax=Convolutriloba macropyga TaxID=536237 RepID=UPI003F51DA92
MAESLAVCRLSFKRKTIIDSLPHITSCQIAIYLYSSEVLDQLVRDSIIQSAKPSQELYDQLVKICRTKTEAFTKFLEALERVDRKDLADQIASSEVFDTLKIHLNFFGKNLIIGNESRVDDFVDYILAKTLKLIIIEESINKDREQFDAINLGYNAMHHSRDNSGSSTPSVGYNNRIMDLALADAFGEKKRWELSNFQDVSFLHGKFTLLDGPAGIGKSTLLGQIACRFLKGDLPKFQNVILLTCRKLNQFGGKKMTFEHFIQSYGYTVDFDFSSPHFADQLFLFDGFEEYNRRWTFGKEMTGVEGRVSVDSSEMTTDEWIRYLMCSNGKSVVIAARPGSLRFLKDYPYKLRLRVLGFSDQMIREFFKMHGSADKLDWLLRTKDYLSIYSQLYKPLISSYYIKVLNHNFVESSLPCASSELYKRMFLLHIEENCYVHEVPEMTGIKTKMTTKNLVPALNVISVNQIKVPSDIKEAYNFLLKVCSVCFQMLCSDCKVNDCCSKNPSLRKSQISEDQTYEIAKRCGLFVHYDHSAFLEQEDVLLPHHLRAVEFGAAIFLVQKFYSKVSFLLKNAVQSAGKILSKQKVKSLFGGVDENAFPDDVIRFAVGILAHSEGNIVHRQIQALAKLHCASLCRHLSDNTILRLSVEVPEDTVWFWKMKERVNSLVEGMFETLPPASRSTINSTNNPVRLRLNNTDDQMQPSVLFALAQLLKAKATQPIWIPTEIEFLWIKFAWFINAVLEIPGVCTNLTALHFWGCRFIKNPDSVGVLQSCSNLRHISLQYCGLSKLSEVQIEEVFRRLPSTLETLDLSRNNAVLKATHFDALKQLNCLRSVILFGNTLRPYDIIKMLPQRVETLSLAKTDFDSSSNFNFSETFPHLRNLNLSWNKITPAQFMEKLSPSLEQLSLQRNYFSLKDSNVKFFNFSYLHNLQVLSLADMKLGNGILELPETIFPQGLLELDLSGSDFTMDETQTNELFSKIPTAVQHLDVSSNVLKFGSKLSSLSRLSNLLSLDVRDVNNMFDKHVINLVTQLQPTIACSDERKLALKLPKYCQKFEENIPKTEIEITYS